MRYGIRIDGGALMALAKKKQDVMDRAAKAMLDRRADEFLDAWRAGASGTFYPGMRKPFYSTSYANDLIRTSVSKSGDDFSVEVGHKGAVAGKNGKTFDLVATIENGREPRDIKDAALRGPGVKTTKDGSSQFVIIPFRHGSGESVHFKYNVTKQAQIVVK